jgi:hypothetical protein
MTHAHLKPHKSASVSHIRREVQPTRSNLRCVSTLDLDAFLDPSKDSALRSFTTDDVKKPRLPMHPFWFERSNSCGELRTGKPAIENKNPYGRVWVPEHLTEIRENTIKQMRPFLENLNTYLAKQANKDPSNNINYAIISELKSIIIHFLVTSAKELQGGKCKKFITGNNEFQLCAEL